MQLARCWREQIAEQSCGRRKRRAYLYSTELPWAEDIIVCSYLPETMLGPFAHLTPTGWFLSKVREEPVHPLPWKNSQWSPKQPFTTHPAPSKHTAWLGFCYLLFWPVLYLQDTHNGHQGTQDFTEAALGTWSKRRKIWLHPIPHCDLSCTGKIEFKERQPHKIIPLVPGTCMSIHVSMYLSIYKCNHIKYELIWQPYFCFNLGGRQVLSQIHRFLWRWAQFSS